MIEETQQGIRNLKIQLNKIRKKVHEQNELFTKEILKRQKEKQTKLLKLKNSMNDMKNTVESLWGRVKQMGDRISDMEEETVK